MAWALEPHGSLICKRAASQGAARFACRRSSRFGVEKQPLGGRGQSESEPFSGELSRRHRFRIVRGWARRPARPQNFQKRCRRSRTRSATALQRVPSRSETLFRNALAGETPFRAGGVFCGREPVRPARRHSLRGEQSSPPQCVPKRSFGTGENRVSAREEGVNQ